MVVCGGHRMQDKTDEILFQNRLKSLWIVFLGPVAETADGQTAAIAFLAHTDIPLPPEFCDIITGKFGRLGTEFHPEFKYLGTGRYIMQTPTKTHPRVIRVGAFWIKATLNEMFH